MKCFTFFHGEVTPGIQTSISEKGRKLVFLGSKGAKCICKIVFFDKGPDNEPVVNDKGLVFFAYPTRRKFNHTNKKTGEKTLRERVVLKKAFPSSTKILLRINTSTQSSHKINGRWRDIGGWPMEWVNSHGFSNEQRWCDDLVAMDDQDAVMIIPAGGGRYDRRVVRNDRGVISCIPERDYHDIMEAHEKEMAMKEKLQISAAEAVDDISEEEMELAVEAVKNGPETKNVSEPEEFEAKPPIDEVEKGKAPREIMQVVTHTEEGETIGV